MLTMDALREYGADVEEGLGRCLNNEAFYLRMVGMAVKDEKIAALAAAPEKGDLNQRFELAHALALTPLSAPLSELTELLRAGTKMDYRPLAAEIAAQKAKLDALAAG